MSVTARSFGAEGDPLLTIGPDLHVYRQLSAHPKWCKALARRNRGTGPQPPPLDPRRAK